MTSLARSSDGKYMVLAGEKIFKLIRIEGAAITEKDDLRAAITSYAATHSDTSSLQQLDIKDVQWSHSELSSTIITASANGKITLHDVNRVGSGTEVGRIQGHLRQINKISVNPHKGNWLLSASQDGTIKLFDLRVQPTGQGVATFSNTSMYRCNAEAVRDVKWSPKDGMEFACGTDAGVVQKWDVRQTMSPLLKLNNAHTKACRSISWHPDGMNLISGGLDQNCHVWDMSKTADRRQKPKHTIQTPAPVSIVSWRPPKWTSTFEKWRAAQVAVVYDDTNPAEMQESIVQIWDIARPALPFKEIFDFDTSPTALLWHGPDLIWTVGKYGAFTQSDVAFAPKTIDNRSLACISISSTGELLMAVDKRVKAARQRPVPPTTVSALGGMHLSGSNSGSHTSNRSVPNISPAFRAENEDDLIGNFLNVRPRRRRRRAELDSQTSTATASNQAPPTLAESLEITGEFVSKQLLGYGRVPGTADPQAWNWLSKVYLGCIYEERKDALDASQPPLNCRFEHIMEQWALANERLKYFRAAQCWRIIGLSLGTTLGRRAAFHRDQRVARYQALQEQMEKEKKMAAKQEKETRSLEQEKQRKNPSQESHTPAKSIIAEQIESTSNVATPLARPSQAFRPAIQIEELALSPPALSSSADTGGYDFYDTASIVPAIDIVAPQRKAPLQLHYPEVAESSAASGLKHHDSTESFEMFSTSEDSKVGRFESSSDNEDKDTGLGYQEPASQEVESSWESNLSPEDQGKGKQIEQPGPPLLVVQEASLFSAAFASVDDKAETPRSENDPQSPTALDPSEIIESDYYYQPGDPLFMTEPLSPDTVVSEWFNYESSKGVLNTAAIVLFIKPFLMPGTIDDNQARQILLHFHQRLNSMSLFTAATLLRKLCVPDYPAIYEQGRWGKEIGFACGMCGTMMIPDPKDPSAMKHCKKCNANMDGCSLCQQMGLPDTIDGGLEQSEFDPKAPGAEMWVWCQGCQHGGHAACLTAWHAQGGELFSGGECPVEGCGHACIPGRHQDELTAEVDARTKAELERLVRERRGSVSTRGIRRDSEEVTMSNAVESVRGVL